MDKINMECPKCGAAMTLYPEKSEAVCEYCGHKVAIKIERSDEEEVRLAEEVSYAKEKGYRRAREEADARRRLHKIIGVVIGVLIAVVIALTNSFVTWHSKPEVDPFNYVEVTFTGVDGEGRAALNTLNGKDDTDVSDLAYEISPSRELSEGDFVTVSASSRSDKYRLSATSKKYEVAGLQLYLTDLTALEDSQLELIYDENSDKQEYNFESAYSDVHFGKIKPVMLCLLTDGKKESKLYVISRSTCKYEDLSKTHYLVTEMDDVVAADGKISFGFSWYRGNITGSVSKNGRGFIFSYGSLKAALSDIKSSDTSLNYSEMELDR